MKLHESQKAIDLLQRWQQGKPNQTLDDGVWYDWTPFSDVSFRRMNRHRAKPDASIENEWVPTQPLKTDRDWQECYPSRVAFWICSAAGICASIAAGLGYIIGILSK
jgi:hypothetical protein